MSGPFAALDGAGFPPFEPGSVWLVGAGPGSPGLLTLLGFYALGRADVVVHDALVSPELLKFASPEAILVFAGKRGGKPSPKQADITLRLIEEARAGKRVLRLKGGDPMLFGRGAEEAAALWREGIKFRLVPGISSGLGGLAYAGIPVTHRDTNQAVIFLTGHEESGELPQAVDWGAVANAAPVIVMFMAVKHLQAIAARLIAAGRDPFERLAIVSHASLPDQSVIETILGKVDSLGELSTPAIVVLGPVNRYREILDWYVGDLRGLSLAKGVVIAAPRSGSGKTLLTLAIIAALRGRGFAIAAAKTGPDYIDTAILSRVAGRPAVNLDPWAMAPARTTALAGAQADADLLVVEGVMGLFDGAADGRGSTGDLAQGLGLPVILVVDGRHQSQSIAPLVAGFANWRPDLKVAGVIVNRVGSMRHQRLLVGALGDAGFNVLGAIPEREELALPGRHLGLVLPEDFAAFDRVVDMARVAVADYVDLAALMALGAALPVAASNAAPRLPPLGQRIAIARDAAFAFLYAHWLADWRAAGATLSFFSPLADESPAADADAVFLPGGYPELHCGKLAAAQRFKAGLGAAAARGSLVYGECGGFMVLGRSITDKDEKAYAMTGLLPVETAIAEPRRVLGYRRLAHASPLPWPARLNGHEFHYSHGSARGTPALFEASDALGTTLPAMGACLGRVMGSYAHVIDVA